MTWWVLALEEADGFSLRGCSPAGGQKDVNRFMDAVDGSKETTSSLSLSHLLPDLSTSLLH